MTEKTARANIRKALALFRSRIKFPKIRLRQMLASEDIISIIKEVVSSKIQKFLGGG
jgi:hypothetical protein